MVNMRELSLFSGAGGGLLGSKLLGWTTIGYVEWSDYCQRVIRQRIKDGILDNAPIFGDIRAFNDQYAERYRGLVDVVTGGFPCQDISIAGHRKGIESERSGLWKEMLRAISILRPKYAFVENSPMLTVRGLNRVTGDLSEIGYDCKWCVIGVDDIAGPHQRKRVWILCSDTTQIRWFRTTNTMQGKTSKSIKVWCESEFLALLDSEKSQYEVKSEDQRMGDGISFGMDRFSAIGNGQVPAVVRAAWIILSEGIV